MNFPSLGVAYYIDLHCRNKEIPQNSVAAVSIDRKKIAELIQQRKVKISSFLDRVGLSTSRYYRWINYEIDIPFEYIFGIKKLLGISDEEFLALLSPSTDELIDTLALASFYNTYSYNPDKLETILNRLDKYRLQLTSPFFKVYTYTQIISQIARKQKPDVSSFFKNNDKYFQYCDDLTDFDIYLNILNLNLKRSLFPGKQINSDFLVSQKILSGLKSNDLDRIYVYWGCAIDFVMNFYINHQADQAIDFLKQVYQAINTSGAMDDHLRNCYEQIGKLLTNKVTFPSFSQSILQSQPVFNYENDFWNEIHNFIKMNIN
ncbi:helix-turn-helix domain-containing protein [Fructilactobacillus fructivorans]|uniref:Uncharacterized protein n=1 Tax=Fructilactobacillus fructivorans TaxID=1614 RepID=A0AAE6P2Z9_9LACO|nr:helix-turn-helix transcriptional regulator [Fructilactobacillus fructivorans]KRK58026.1 hypothetical protein FC73_GL000403 [Fructilactobacillus fructivorans]QFX93260.1 hypothetical protein LF543_06820 [Fructilactobacillus fructivorans]RDV65081.1 XRE family transcriptional regulator [Fructilactobacillus fructivorans]